MKRKTRVSDGCSIYLVCMANETQFNYTEEILMDNAGYIAAAVALLIIGVLGFFLNLFVIILMLRDKQVSYFSLFKGLNCFTLKLKW